jgi:hypothetical protein
MSDSTTLPKRRFGAIHTASSSVLATLILAACQGSAAPIAPLLDDLPPYIAAFTPMGDTFGGDSITVRLSDVRLQGHGTSGPDPASVQIRVAGAVLPIELDGSTWRGSIAHLPDGPLEVEVSARDFAGNQLTAIKRFLRDRLPPLIYIDPGGNLSDITNPEAKLAVYSTVVDASPTSVQLTVSSPGSDDVCGTTDDALLQQARRAGGAALNPILRSVTPSAATLTQNFVVYNAAAWGAPARLSRYCITLSASDATKNAAGVSAPNRSSITVERTVLWLTPAHHTQVYGSGQIALPGWRLVPLAIYFRDPFSTGVAGIPVEFSVTTGGGSIVGDNVTRPGGVATAEWTAGPLIGQQLVGVTVNGNPLGSVLEARVLDRNQLTWYRLEAVDGRPLPNGGVVRSSLGMDMTNRWFVGETVFDAYPGELWLESGSFSLNAQTGNLSFGCYRGCIQRGYYSYDDPVGFLISDAVTLTRVGPDLVQRSWLFRRM